MANAYDIYRKQSLDTSSPAELVGKLYGKAALVLRLASRDVAERRLDSANRNIQKAEEILTALDGSLDMAVPLSAELHTLYGYMFGQLLEANRRKDTQILDRISEWLAGLRDTWEQAMEANHAAG